VLAGIGPDKGTGESSAQASKHAPALAVLGSQLVMTYVANNSNNDILVTTSTNGTTWTSSGLTGQASATAPAPTSTSSKIAMAYVANNSSNDLLWSTSTNGTAWTPYRTLTELGTPSG
jgi:hypothetical protein